MIHGFKFKAEKNKGIAGMMIDMRTSTNDS